MTIKHGQAMGDFPASCVGCRYPIDPDLCGCGEMRDNHGYQDGHSFIPSGCQCYRDRDAKAEAKRRGLDMRRTYDMQDGALWVAVRFTSNCSGCACESHDSQCSCPSNGCHECGYTGKRRRVEFVPADRYGPHGPGTRSSRRYGEYLQIRNAHTELTFRDYLRHFAGQDGRA